MLSIFNNESYLHVLLILTNTRKMRVKKSCNTQLSTGIVGQYNLVIFRVVHPGVEAELILLKCIRSHRPAALCAEQISLLTQTDFGV
jgi:hypothetical protein